MSINNPRIVLDLGAGSGSLTIAAQRRWAKAHIFSVDSDPRVCFRVKGDHTSNYRHFTFDALSSELAESLGLQCGTVDAAVCNPPFIRPKWRPRYAELLEEVGFSGAFPAIQETGADVLFLAQNLRLLRTAGQLGLIVPDGIVAGIKHQALRRILIEKHKVQIAIALPRNAFRLADAQTYILVLRKDDVRVTRVELQELKEVGGLSESIFIDPEEAIQRLDYPYHQYRTIAKVAYLSGYGATASLEQIGAEITRGLMSSSEARRSTVHVLHTTNFPTAGRLVVPRRKRVSTHVGSLKKAVIAEPGDILLARVGRNIEKKICMVVEGRIAISDCIYRIRVDERWKTIVFDALSSKEGRNWISTAACGVGARQLPKATLLSFEIRFR